MINNEEKTLPNFLKNLNIKELRFDSSTISKKIKYRSSSINNISNKFNISAFNLNIKKKVKELVYILDDNVFLNLLAMGNFYDSKTNELIKLLLEIIQYPTTDNIISMVFKIKEIKYFIKENIKFCFKKLNTYLNLIKNKLEYIFYYLKNRLLSKKEYDIEYRREIKNYFKLKIINISIKNISKGVNKRRSEKIKCKICGKNIILKIFEEHNPICFQEKNLSTKISNFNDNINNIIDSILFDKQKYYLDAFDNNTINEEEHTEDNKLYFTNKLKNMNVKVPIYLDSTKNNSSKKIENIEKKNFCKKSVFNKFKNQNLQSIKTYINKNNKNNLTEKNIKESISDEESISSNSNEGCFGDNFFNSSDEDKKNSENESIEIEEEKEKILVNKAYNTEKFIPKISNKSIQKDIIYDNEEVEVENEKENCLGDAYFNSDSSYDEDKESKANSKEEKQKELEKKDIFNKNNTSEENIKASFEYNKKNDNNLNLNIKNFKFNNNIKSNNKKSINNKNESFFDWNKFNKKIPSFTEKFGAGGFNFNLKNNDKPKEENFLENIEDDNEGNSLEENEINNTNININTKKFNILSSTINLKNIISRHNDKKDLNIDKVQKFIRNLDRIQNYIISYPFEINYVTDTIEYFSTINFQMNEDLKNNFNCLLKLTKEKFSYLKRIITIRNKLKKHTNEKNNFYNFSFRARKDFLNEEIKNKYTQSRNNSNYDVVEENKDKEIVIEENIFENFIRKSKSETCLYDKKNNTNFKSLIEANDFKYINDLGEGAYGKVVKIQRISTGDYYALKIIPFKKNIEDKEIESLINERSIFGLVTNKFLVTAYFSFIYNNNCLFVMELIKGGDFKKILKEYGCLEIEEIRFYAAELIVAINYLHSKKIIHRDLKPENWLLDEKGHLKVADFGLSKIKKKNFEEKIKFKTNIKEDNDDNFYMDSDTVGTPNYIAYEAFDKDYTQNESVDWWAVGCILYEFAVGIPMFNGSTKQEVFNKIKNIQYELPNIGEGDNELPLELKDLIEKFIEKNPAKRLGNNGLEEIKNHSFFKNFDWNKINYEFGSYVPDDNYDRDSKISTQGEQVLNVYLNKNFKSNNINQNNKKSNINKNFEMIRFDLLHNENKENWNSNIQKINLLNKVIKDYKNEKKKWLKNCKSKNNIWFLKKL